MAVQRGSITITNTTNNIVDITPVAVGKSYVEVSVRVNALAWTSRVSAHLATIVDGKYTQIIFRKIITGTAIVEWNLIEDSRLSVQSGLTLWSGSATFVHTVSISSVELSETYAVLSSGGSSDINQDTGFQSIRLLSKSQMQLRSSQAVTATKRAAWYVVSLPGATVSQYTSLIPSFNYIEDFSISDINLNNTFIAGSWVTAGTGMSSYVSFRFTSATNLRIQVGGSGPNNVRWVAFIVSHPDVECQHMSHTLSTSQSASVAINSVDVNKAWVVSTTYGESTDTSNDGSATAQIASSTAVDVRKESGTGATRQTHIFFTVIELITVVNPLSPKDNKALLPNEDNIFAWQEVSGQSAYEIRYNSGGSWISTGEIGSSAVQHTFPAGTFAAGLNYEWQIRVWSGASVSAWSASAAFNTIYPVLRNLSPAEGDSVNAGITQISAMPISPTGAQCRLKVEVADNDGFAGSDEYLSALVSSGSTISFEHAFVDTGYYYIRYTAIDAAALESDTEVAQISVVYMLYFISDPVVNTQGPQATHVTVRVRGTSTGATAHITPEPSADKRIERLVEIDSGTVAICESVSAQLIQRWGREQISVTGQIPMIVTLRYKNKVRIKIPEAGLDTDLILQKKVHNVFEATTTITCGDIIFDDSELLARILDEL